MWEKNFTQNYIILNKAKNVFYYIKYTAEKYSIPKDIYLEFKQLTIKLIMQ